MMYVKIWQNYTFQTIEYTETLQKAFDKISSEEENLVVVRRDGTLYNLITFNDITTTFSSYGLDTKLIEILDPTDSFLFDTDLLEDALVLMLENRARVLPVVNNEMRPVGIFGLFEVLKAFKTISAIDETGTRALIKINDVPGELSKLLSIFANRKINLLSLMTAKISDEKRMISLKLGIKNIDLISDILDEENIEYEGIYEENGDKDR
ncbi:CBS domain-containing protein [Petrotoga sp. 9T1HF07.CasAA.8.2]|uniref:CBS domain-containing protein n=1 Tax=Petrotoga sp. 9T1HF07.CasAA.8.2 TaxID=1434329 RepID=UPI000EFADEC0|nr:CBS domain-containing protein [Petrotoga sp. 9T1HF07.CasAA.8.2]